MADPSSFRSVLKPRAKEEAQLVPKAVPKLGRSVTHASGMNSVDGYRHAGAAAGPGTSAYTAGDLERNTSQSVMAANMINPQAQRPDKLSMSKGSMEEFAGAGLRAGLYVWRIEELKPVPWPEVDVGKFCVGDSYIVLKSEIWKNKLIHHIHYWLGSESTIDETGACAYKVVELEEKLGGEAPQHREVEGHEGPLFLSYFPNGIEYVEGGVESAFTHVERDVYQTRLLHLKGKKVVRAKQVRLTFESLNDGDVFILDSGLRIFQWNGKQSSRQERTKGVHMLQKIRDQERLGKAKSTVLDQDDEDDRNPDWQEFWKLLGGKGPIATADEGGDDAEEEMATKATMRLFRISDASGELEVTEVVQRPLKKRLLDPMDAFLLDCQTEIFVWVGKGATAQEKQESMNYARKFLVKYNRPAWTPITRILEGSESPLFREKFEDWPEEMFGGDGRATFSKLALLSKLAAVAEATAAEEEIDIAAMHKRSEVSINMHVHAGDGQLNIWYAQDGKLRASPPGPSQGILCENNVYLIQYSYHPTEGKPGELKNLIYEWHGRLATLQDKHFVHLAGKALSEEVKMVHPPAVLVQGTEDDLFLSLFRGKSIVRIGDQFPVRKVTFYAAYPASLSENVFVSGSNAALGKWDVELAVQLFPASLENMWTATVPVPFETKSFEYKLLVRSEDRRKAPKWENIPANRTLTIPADDDEDRTLMVCWDQPERTEVSSVSPAKEPTSALFHIRGNSSMSTRAMQVASEAKSLNSGDAFVAQSSKVLWLWCGKGCNEGERQYAKVVAEILVSVLLAKRQAEKEANDKKGKDSKKDKKDKKDKKKDKKKNKMPKLKEVEEGQEKDKFWKLLGGKAPYASAEVLAAQNELPPARLFWCTNASGSFKVDSIEPFTQNDLHEDDVMILDTFTEVFVWFGSGCNETEKKRGMAVAMKYTRSADDGRAKNTPVSRVYAGGEPAAFKAQFLGWRDGHADPYITKLREMALVEAGAIQAGKEKIQTTQAYTAEFETKPPAAGEASPAPGSPGGDQLRKLSASTTLSLTSRKTDSKLEVPSSPSTPTGPPNLKAFASASSRSLPKFKPTDDSPGVPASVSSPSISTPGSPGLNSPGSLVRGIDAPRPELPPSKDISDLRAMLTRIKTMPVIADNSAPGSPAEVRKPEAVVAPPPVPTGIAKFCATCGTARTVGLFCMNCGSAYPILTPAAPAPAPAPAPVVAAPAPTPAPTLAVAAPAIEVTSSSGRNLAPPLVAASAPAPAPTPTPTPVVIPVVAPTSTPAITTAASAEPTVVSIKEANPRLASPSRGAPLERSVTMTGAQLTTDRTASPRREEGAPGVSPFGSRREALHRAGSVQNFGFTSGKADPSLLALVVPAAPAPVSAQWKPHRYVPYHELWRDGDVKKAPEDVDDTRLEAYLSDPEFQQIFRMSKTQFYKEPAWKQRQLKTKHKLW